MKPMVIRMLLHMSYVPRRKSSIFEGLIRRVSINSEKKA
jgi:hypothetical protein